MKGNKKLYFLLIGVFLLSACASNTTKVNDSVEEYYSEPTTLPQLESDWSGMSEAEAAPESAEVSNKSVHQKKIIFGNTEVETNNFDDNIITIKDFIKNKDGYIENTNITTNNINSGNEYRIAYLILKVPAENYEELKKFISDLGTTKRFGENEEDVTWEYFDVEKALETKKHEETRLLELSQKATEISDIIEIEKRLGEVRTDKEIYETRLANMDRLINFCTLEVNLIENKNTTVNVGFDNFGSKIVNAFKSSINFMARLIEYIIVGISWIIIPVIIIAVIVLVILLYKKRKK